MRPFMFNAGVATALVIGAFFAGKSMPGGDPAAPDGVFNETPLAMVGDSARGKATFVTEGCVICHSVNGVGGRAAPGLDAREWPMDTGAYDFAARMWAGAPIMSQLQRMEIGYQINLTGQKLADLTAFARDEEMQASFTMEDVPQDLQETILGEIIMEEDFLNPAPEEDIYDYAEPEQE